MTETTRRKIPLAYVTKWATTRGIMAVKDAEESGESEFGLSTKRYLIKRGLFVPSAHWTEDRDEAIKRWRAAVVKKAASLREQAATMDAVATGDPVFEAT